MERSGPGGQDRRVSAPELVACLVILDPLATAALEAGGGDARSVAVLIGPEGGLTEDEEARAESAGGVRRRLGQHVLRTETAAIAACAVLLLPGVASRPEASDTG